MSSSPPSFCRSGASVPVASTSLIRLQFLDFGIFQCTPSVQQNATEKLHDLANCSYMRSHTKIDLRPLTLKLARKLACKNITVVGLDFLYSSQGKHHEGESGYKITCMAGAGDQVK
ncbi:hypothetical protein L2E82_00737 [Cichorium intybus]|uniref:Uncharacterized protein n=1 Tax=Cichorium intybus TaxID=13427 RepID=A0ACB9GXN5_CICIN|nr:hypothetical protein L2E82_00737 [Cichorium intybus]